MVSLFQEEWQMSRADNDALEAKPQVAVLARALYKEEMEKKRGSLVLNGDVVMSFNYLMDHHQYPYLAKASALLCKYKKIHNMLMEEFDLNKNMQGEKDA